MNTDWINEKISEQLHNLFNSSSKSGTGTINSDESHKY